MAEQGIQRRNMAPITEAVYKAYDRDPRTRLAQSMLTGAGDGTPVYGIYDGIAKALQGVAGGLMMKSASKKFKADEDAYMAEMAALLGGGSEAAAGGAPPPQVQPGVPGIGGAPAATATGQSNGPAPLTTPPPDGSTTPLNAQGGAGGLPPVAQMLGNQPPPQVAPQPPQMGAGGPPSPAPAMAGGDPALMAPQAPQAPTVDDPKEAIRKRIGLALMGGNNPYFFDQGLEHYNAGIQDEQRMAEQTDERRFQLKRDKFTADTNDYLDSRASKRNSEYDRIKGTREFEQALERDEKQFGYQLTLQEKQDAAAMARAGLGARTSIAIARMNNDTEMQKAWMTIEATGKSPQDKLQAKKDAYFLTAHGTKVANETATTIGKNDTLKADLQAFKDINKNTQTGGFVNTYLPGLAGIRNGNIKEMKAITEKIAPSLRVAGDIMSDADKQAYRESVTNISANRQTNARIADRLSAGLERQNMYERAKLEAISTGTINDFLKNWQAYKTSVPLFSKKGDNPYAVRSDAPAYDEWLATRPKYNAQGQRIQ